MKKIFLSILGWLAAPGFKYAGLKTGPIESRKEAYVVVLLAVIACLAYGAVAVYFGHFYTNNLMGITSPIAALVWLFNFVLLAFGVIALLVRRDWKNELT